MESKRIGRNMVISLRREGQQYSSLGRIGREDSVLKGIWTRCECIRRAGLLLLLSRIFNIPDRGSFAKEVSVWTQSTPFACCCAVIRRSRRSSASMAATFS